MTSLATYLCCASHFAWLGQTASQPAGSAT